MNQHVIIEADVLHHTPDAWLNLCRIWKHNFPLSVFNPKPAASFTFIQSMLYPSTATELYQHLIDCAKFPDSIVINLRSAGQLQRSPGTDVLIFSFLKSIYMTDPQPRLLRHLLANAVAADDECQPQLPDLLQLPAATEDFCRAAIKPQLLFATTRSLRTLNDFCTSGWLSEDLRSHQYLNTKLLIATDLHIRHKPRLLPDVFFQSSRRPQDFSAQDLATALKLPNFRISLASITVSKLNNFVDDLQAAYPTHARTELQPIFDTLAARVPISALEALLSRPEFKPTLETFKNIISRGAITVSKPLIAQFADQFTPSLLLELAVGQAAAGTMRLAGHFFNSLTGIDSASEDEIRRLVDIAVRCKAYSFLLSLFKSRELPATCLTVAHCQKLYKNNQTELLQAALDSGVSVALPGTLGYIAQHCGFRSLPQTPADLQKCLLSVLLNHETSVVPLTRISRADRPFLKCWNAAIKTGADLQAIRKAFRSSAVQSAISYGVPITREYIEHVACDSFRSTLL